jgi:hypothetical protein
MALMLHDRDDAPGTPIMDKLWPDESMDPSQSLTWGRIAFGYPGYDRPAVAASDTIVIQGPALVQDVAVGGGPICGEDAREPDDFFGRWGDYNRADGEFHIQNQSDVADWPCFSKGYLRFLLDAVPEGTQILSATLRLYHWGGSDPAHARPSFIQVLSVGRDWDNRAITWNNAPPAVENIGGARVPVISFPGWNDPSAFRYWDVTRGVAQACQAGEPFRIALYEADGAYHSGKHFVRSTVEDWNADARPRLEIILGRGASSNAAACFHPGRYSVNSRSNVEMYSIDGKRIPSSPFSGPAAVIKQLRILTE